MPREFQGGVTGRYAVTRTFPCIRCRRQPCSPYPYWSTCISLSLVFATRSTLLYVSGRMFFLTGACASRDDYHLLQAHLLEDHGITDRRVVAAGGVGFNVRRAARDGSGLHGHGGSVADANNPIGGWRLSFPACLCLARRACFFLS